MTKSNIWIIVLTIIGINAIGLFSIIETIEKHSVHPIYGNYKKFDSDMKKCEPWQACK